MFNELDDYKEKKSPIIPLEQDKWEDDLASWLEDMHVDNGSLSDRMRCGPSEEPRKVNFDHVTLYRCSWCSNPSAVLRKCEIFPLFVPHVKWHLTRSCNSRQRMR